MLGHHVVSQASTLASIHCFVLAVADLSVIVVNIILRGNDCPLASLKILYNSYAVAFVFPK